MREDGPAKILLIEANFDDAAEIREMMVAHDASWFESTHATTLPEALRCLKAENFDLVLFDSTLPGISGEEAFAQVFEIARAVPIILLADLHSTMQAIQLLQRGAHDYLVKGQLSGSGLKRLIVKALDRNRGMTLWDETDRQRQHELEKVVNTDPLTGLYNRRHLRERLMQEMFRCERAKSPLSIMIIEIDRLDDVVRLYGQETADQVIVALAALLKHRFRVTDILGRYDPTRFCVLMPDTDIEGADVTASRLRVRIEKQAHRTPGDKETHVSCSIGLAAFDKTIIDTVGLIRRAEKALEKARAAGGNRVVTFTAP